MPSAQVKPSQWVPSLKKLLGSGTVDDSAINQILYSRDMMTRGTLQLRQGQIPYKPNAVVWPSSTQDVSRLLRWASREKVPVIPYGAGSGVSGGVVPLHGGISCDLKRMDKIVLIDEKNRTATVESGIIGEHLEEQLSRHGWTLGHFPSSIMTATLGGYLATRSAGQLSSKYGKIEDMVEALEVVLPNGRVVPMGKPLPNFPGMDTRGLFVGSEGTLGIITKARLKIFPQPQTSVFKGISFNHLGEALSSIRRIMQSGLRPSVIRLYDPLDSLLLQWGYSKTDSSIFGDLLNTALSPLRLFSFLYSPVFEKISSESMHQILQRPYLLDPVIRRLPIESLLILGFEGDKEVIQEEIRLAYDFCKKVICRDLGEKPGLHWLKHRYSVSFKMPQFLEDGNFLDTIEVASTWDKLMDLYNNVREAVAREALVLAHFSHAYHEGCSIYFTFIGREPGKEEELKRYDRIWEKALGASLKSGGTISHHHGIGYLKADFMRNELGDLMHLFREFKKKLDPHNIMNPGKMGL
ncbi:MAG: hypothetical protein A2053_06645 [Deltaproteobacteria bacterium GWA2_50_8]|nr:MAG: hypothetical protein A2053_06645 [Deltaproteobacteria bacterium GWA2_50_8]